MWKSNSNSKFDMGFLYYDGVFCAKTSKGCKRPLTKRKELTLPTVTKNVLNMANTANNADPDETPHFVVFFCMFVALIYVPINSYDHFGMVSSPDLTFSWESLNKLLNSTSCTNFRF